VIQALKAQFQDRVVTSLAVREQHGNTVTWVKAEPPDAVVFAHSTEEVSDIVKLCGVHRVPVIAFGTGTSLEGHINAPLGGICLDLSHMKRVIAVHAEDLDCVIEPGLTRKELNEHLRDQGLFFPIDPGADASIGGMVATRASGTNAVRYGTMKDCVLALTVVLPNGDVVRTAQRAKKSSAGYDLTHLFIGSEGTLGIITEITLRLHGIPEAISAGVCQFPSVTAACDAVIVTIQTGIPVARIELLDQMQVRALNLYSKLGLPESPMLLLEFHGSEANVREQAERFGEIAAEHEGNSNGRRSRKTGQSSGRRGMMRIGRCGRCVRARTASPPMFAFRSRVLRSASRKPSVISPRWACLRPSSATSGTGISIACRWSIPMTRRRSRKFRSSSIGWSRGRSP